MTNSENLTARGVYVRPKWKLVGCLFVAISAIAGAWMLTLGSAHWTIYGLAVAVLLGSKLVLSLLPAQRWLPADPTTKTCLIVPMFNEDPEILRRTLASIDAQTEPPTYVRIVDDGSQDRAALDLAHDWASTRPHVEVLWKTNAGKREAMATAFRELAGAVDVFVCVDSDTVLDPDAIAQGLAPLSDPSVAAVTGTVIALNHDQGLLPRLLDLRYVNAFLYERAAYSRLGSVLCVCGSLAFWRSSVIAEHLEDFLDQRFLGERATYGDDRHLTNLSLLHGKVVLARHAIAHTAVPERGGHLLRQQARWGRSFFRESLWSLRNLSPRRVAWWLALVESVSWAGFTVGLLASLFVLPAITGQVMVFDYLAWVTITGWARSVHLFSLQRPGVSRWDQARVFALAPLYGMLHVLVLLPLRLWSLCTLRQKSWGTRSTGVEVAYSESKTAA